MTLSPARINDLMEGPAMRPPDNIVPNFNHPHNWQKTALVVEVICFVIPSLTVPIHVFTKVRICREMRLEDYVTFLSWLLFMAILLELNIDAKTFATHQYENTLKELVHFLYRYRLIAITYCVGIFMIKLLILLQYLRIFTPRPVKNFMFWTCHTLIWANLLCYLIIIFLEIFPCKPIAKAWNPLIANGHCINVSLLNLTSTGVNTASDFLVLFLSQTVIWKLKMSLKRRLGVSLVCSAGLLYVHLGAFAWS
ncbi:integral membrane PTH11 protein [Rutstroemia sp. NJR-2017a WRK4]|nr:integral membrane PTH11 protein [Rutstroemia sp. NJR-2017a WRK4]